MLALLRLLIAGLVLPFIAFGCSKSSSSSTPGAAPAASASQPASVAKKKPLVIAYSDWPGWVAWDIAIQKGWFKEAGVEVDFRWFEYVPSMEAYSAKKVDAVCVTNGDALVTGSSGARSITILLNDFSNGNDMLIARPGIEKVEQLKGKKVGVEVGFVSHLFLMNALQTAGLTDKDVTLVNVPTDQTPQTLKSGQVDAIAAWQPHSGSALKLVSGAKPIFTSANLPGIIYDVLAVSPTSLSERRDDWKKVIAVWQRITQFMKDEKNLPEVTKIMAARVGLTPEEYGKLLGGTYILDLAENAKRFEKGPGLDSIWGSNELVNKFNVENKVYKEAVPIADYLDGSLVREMLTAKP
jgi:NitT/TauT family transport system substrate-binding protein